MGLKLGGQFRPLAIKGYHFFLRLAGRSPVVTCAPVNRGARPKPDFATLEKQYPASDLAQEPETFVLYRIIGNDLPPRHRKGQSRDSLAFILEHEPELPGCEKRFVVNYNLIAETPKDPSHFREYTMAEISDYVSRAGFEILENSFENYFDYQYLDHANGRLIKKRRYRLVNLAYTLTPPLYFVPASALYWGRAR